MLANELINEMERRGLLDQEIIEALREQLSQGGASVTPEAVAKLLVDNGQLTRFQASKLIGELRSGEYDDQSTTADQELGVDDLEVVEDEVTVVSEAVPVEAVPVDAVPVEAVAVDATPVEAVPVEAVPVEAVAVEATPVQESPSGARPSSGGNGNNKRPTKPEDNEWDSFKVYGFVGIIVFLAGMIAGLYFLLSSGNAEDEIKLADDAYAAQNYTVAQTRYESFVETWGEDHKDASKSRVRVVLTELYRAEQKSDPTLASDLSVDKLPTIEQEEAITGDRPNLAGLLIDIANNIAEAATKVPETEKKRKLIMKLDKHMELFENANYIDKTLRETNKTKLDLISEKRARAARDIKRNEQLDKAVNNMSTLLESKDTKAAYDIHSELLREYPELRRNERLVKLILQASDIQNELVSASVKTPQSITPNNDKDVEPIILMDRSGNRVSSPTASTYFVPAAGSVLAFNVEDGTLQWRRYVGNNLAHSPVPLEGGDAVLLSVSTDLTIERCDGRSGMVIWKTEIGEPYNQPIVARDYVYVTTVSGKLFKLDATTGEGLWSTTIPQTVNVGPGVDNQRSVLYQPGGHSNLYVVNARSGESMESFYIGHREGTIAVPPVALLDHLFVLENHSQDTCMIHILNVDQSGGGLKKAQDPITIEGNVVVAPLLDKRRIIVLSDLGEIKVLDIEPSSEGEKVSVIADVARSYSTPTLSQMTLGQNELWTTGSKFSRYEIQANRGQVVPREPAFLNDAFVGEPLFVGDAVLHARRMNGTDWIRVGAAEPSSSDSIWNADVSAPIELILPIDGGVRAITSQAALFELEDAAIASKSLRTPLESPDDASIETRFQNAQALQDGRWILINNSDQAGAQKVAIYDPSRANDKLRLISLNLVNGVPGGPALCVANGLFVPLNNGRALLLNYQTGGQISNPFQPSSSPSEKVTWTNSIIVPEDKTQIVLADNRKGIYRLRVGDQISPLAEGKLPSQPLGSIAGLNNTVFVPVGGTAADKLLGFDMASLKPKFETQTAGRVVWGPMNADQHVLILTNDQMLRAYDDQGQEQYAVKVGPGKAVGKPLLHDGKLVLAGAAGWVAVIDPSAGQLSGWKDIGQPFSATPLPYGQQLLVPGAEGVIFSVDMPQGGQP
ncbi:outer membrane biogenesis protein BamB [Stieleria bergensis]|uniref:Outer membrane biogenesis protein BamB n=1 Tax=Stieleria bergensis TaxID=2528025 RepID=A0A517SNN5_9BACT|nr:outer membrane biogenesis protein BamB [Planctomycetes bacterium SV_7m_r]